MVKRRMYPLNIQLFAEGGVDDGGATETGGGNEEQTFDEVLANETYKAEYDSRVQAAVDKAVETERAKWDEKAKEAQTEAQKLANMTTAQKKEYEAQKREDEIAKREAAITRRELTATAKETFASKGLPIELADILDYTDAESCNASLQAVEAAFNKAVEAKVNDKLRGHSVGAGSNKAPYTRDSVKRMSAEDINKHWDEIKTNLTH